MRPDQADDDSGLGPGLAVAVTSATSRWGDGAQALLGQLGGRWPTSPEAQLALCRFVHFRRHEAGPMWVVDDVAGFAVAAGAKPAGDGVQLALDLEGARAPAVRRRPRSS